MKINFIGYFIPNLKFGNDLYTPHVKEYFALLLNTLLIGNVKPEKFDDMLVYAIL